MDEEGAGGTGHCTRLQVGLYPALPHSLTKKETASPELAALAPAAPVLEIDPLVDEERSARCQL
jgi:hypothetical protein